MWVLHWRYWPCYLIALIASVLWNFTLNREFTFKSAGNGVRQHFYFRTYNLRHIIEGSPKRFLSLCCLPAITSIGKGNWTRPRYLWQSVCEAGRTLYAGDAFGIGLCRASAEGYGKGIIHPLFSPKASSVCVQSSSVPGSAYAASFTVFPNISCTFTSSMGTSFL